MQGKKHKHKKKFNKKHIKAKKLVLQPCTPTKMMMDASPTHEAVALERALPDTPSTPSAAKATTTVAFKVKALGSAVLKTMTPASRKSASVKDSPSPSPLRWVSYPIKRSDNIKAVLFSMKDNSTPRLIFNTPPNSIKGAHDSTAIPGAGLPSPAKPRTLAVQLVASATPSAADNVNMGSPPAPMNPNKKSVDGLAVISGNPNKPELSATSPKKGQKPERRGPAAALKLVRTARDNLVSGGASIKRGFRKIAAGTWSGIKRTVTCACFKTSATKA